MPLNPNGYPLDITGVAVTNLITAEIHTFTTTDSRTFVPDGGPFFTQGLQLRHGVTNALLQPMSDYIVLQFNKFATRETYKEVCGIVRILNNNIPSVSIQYQCVGGIYSETVTAIRDVVAQNPVVPNRPVGWGEIIGIPYQFTPSEHLHHADEIYGLQEVVSVLEQIRLAIMAGDSGAFNAVYQYIFTLFENVDYVTQAELDDITDLIPYIPIKVVRNLPELRALNTMANFTPSVYITCGKVDMLDGKGRMWIWDILRTTADNDNTIIMPSVVQGGPGRFVPFLSSDNQLIDIERRLQEAGIAVDVAVTNYTDDDFDILTLTRKWYTGDTNPNMPFARTVLEVTSLSDTDCLQVAYNKGNRATRYGYNGVAHTGHTWTAWVFSEQAELAITANATGSLNTKLGVGKHYIRADNTDSPFLLGVLEVTHTSGPAYHQLAISSLAGNYGVGIATRYTNDAGVNWTDWHYALDTATAKRFGIDVDLAGSLNAIGSGYSLNNYGSGGKYWISNGVLDAPMDSITGLPVEYAVFYIDQLNSTDCIQTVYKLGQISRRYGSAGTNYTGHTWSGWVTEVTHKDLNDAYDDLVGQIGDLDTDLSGQIDTLTNSLTADRAGCNAGITVRNVGTTSALLMARIGDYASPFVKVYIGGEFVVIDIRNIPPLYAADDNVHPNNSLLYVYLEVGGVAGYQLHCYTTAPVWGPFSKSVKRAPLTFDGESGISSPVLFLGMAWLLSGRWQVVRSWFQDPGLCDHYALYAHARNDVLAQPPVSGALARIDFGDDMHADSGSSSLYSSYWSSFLQPIYIIAWGGEIVDVVLSGQVAVSNPVAGLWGAYIHMSVEENVTGYGTMIDTSTVALSPNVANAFSNGYWQPVNITDSFKAPGLGVYRVLVWAQPTNAGSTVYLRGRHSGSASYTVLMAKLRETHSYEQLVITAYPPPPVTYTVVLTDNYYTNANMYDLFVAEYGDPNAIPLLASVTWEIRGNVTIISQDDDSNPTGPQVLGPYLPSITLDSRWPPSIRPIIRNYGRIIGYGGRGGNSTPDNLGGDWLKGSKGGTAIYSVRGLTLLNASGKVGGGGGGGGQGSSASSGGTGSFGGAGGVGAGFWTAYTRTPYHDGGSYTGAGLVGLGTGSDPTYIGGLGGISLPGGPHNENFSQGGSGGRGGDLGQPGAAGLGPAASDYGSNAQPGGAAGSAIECGGDGIYIPGGEYGEILGPIVRI